jgi:hypothetical protein
MALWLNALAIQPGNSEMCWLIFWSSDRGTFPPISFSTSCTRSGPAQASAAFKAPTTYDMQLSCVRTALEG